jgi:hypothetical protein
VVYLSTQLVYSLKNLYDTLSISSLSWKNSE